MPFLAVLVFYLNWSDHTVTHDLGAYYYSSRRRHRRRVASAASAVVQLSDGASKHHREMCV